jgi:hypothetical protein
MSGITSTPLTFLVQLNLDLHHFQQVGAELERRAADLSGASHGLIAGETSMSSATWSGGEEFSQGTRLPNVRSLILIFRELQPRHKRGNPADKLFAAEGWFPQTIFAVGANR